ncbi:MAG: hypothetical protein A2144_00335 [Chloroflexi bacterium RBG_16_50_9]|nr:MAG: hypothetical protein A2144_00335 [Chloroflexi bacterium RBG_16_50_9]
MSINLCLKSVPFSLKIYNEHLQEKRDPIKDYQRAILQQFKVKVIVYSDLVEIKGTITTQIVDKADKNKEEKCTAPIIDSTSLRKGGGGKG